MAAPSKWFIKLPCQLPVKHGLLSAWVLRPPRSMRGRRGGGRIHDPGGLLGVEFDAQPIECTRSAIPGAAFSYEVDRSGREFR